MFDSAKMFAEMEEMARKAQHLEEVSQKKHRGGRGITCNNEHIAHLSGR